MQSVGDLVAPEGLRQAPVGISRVHDHEASCLEDQAPFRRLGSVGFHSCPGRAGGDAGHPRLGRGASIRFRRVSYLLEGLG